MSVFKATNTRHQKVLLGCVHTWCPSTVPKYDSCWVTNVNQDGEKGCEVKLSLFETWDELHGGAWIRSGHNGTETLAKVNISCAGSILA